MTVETRNHVKESLKKDLSMAQELDELSMGEVQYRSLMRVILVK
jgi:hypothetical protein